MRKAPLGVLLLSLPAVLAAGCSAGNNPEDPYGTSTGTTGTTTGTSTGTSTGDTGTSTGAATGTTTGTSTGDTGPVPGSEVCGTTLTPVSSGLSGHGHGTRYWDCCMPHCAWPQNTSNVVKTCDIDDNELVVTVDEYNTASADSICTGNGEKPLGTTCYDQSPWAACDELAMGYAVVPNSGSDPCGKCYELTFDGKNNDAQYNPDAEIDPGSASLAGKKMIVMGSNTGSDVSSFDLMIPGGGVGMYDKGCGVQWGESNADKATMGDGYGGFYKYCSDQWIQNGGQQADGTQYMPLDTAKDCVRNMCDNLFGVAGREDLLAGCHWYVDWFGAANNPTFDYQEVECPQALIDKY